MNSANHSFYQTAYALVRPGRDPSHVATAFDEVEDHTDPSVWGLARFLVSQPAQRMLSYKNVRYPSSLRPHQRQYLTYLASNPDSYRYRDPSQLMWMLNEVAAIAREHGLTNENVIHRPLTYPYALLTPSSHVHIDALERSFYHENQLDTNQHLLDFYIYQQKNPENETPLHEAVTDALSELYAVFPYLSERTLYTWDTTDPPTENRKLTFPYWYHQQSAIPTTKELFKTLLRTKLEAKGKTVLTH